MKSLRGAIRSAGHYRSRRAAIVFAGLALVLVSASCSSELDMVQSAKGAEGFDNRSGGGTTSDEESDPKTSDPAKTSTDTRSSGKRPYEEVLKLSIADIQDFWAAQMPEVYSESYKPIPTSSMYPYDASHLPPACGGERPRYEDIAGNAYYCSDANYIAWDDGKLFPSLADKFGSFAVALVLAHEWGHAIQGQMGLVDRTTGTVVLEQQADCFAGAWTRHIADGDSKKLELGSASLDTALAGLLAFRDEPGALGSGDAGAHGSGFDRVRAFRDGYEKSLKECTTYTDPGKELVLTEFPFSEEEYQTGGNMAMKDLADALVDDMNAYFTYRYPDFEAIDSVIGVEPGSDDVTCDSDSVTAGDFDKGVFLCNADSKLYVDTNMAADLYQATGDFAVSILFGDGWARRVQLEGGASNSDLDGTSSYEQRLCMIGGYAGSLVEDRVEYPNGNGYTVPGRDRFSISGGDLDEAISSIMKLAAEQSSTQRPDAFKTIGEFQKGVIDGHSACGN